MLARWLQNGPSYAAPWALGPIHVLSWNAQPGQAGQAAVLLAEHARRQDNYSRHKSARNSKSLCVTHVLRYCTHAFPFGSAATSTTVTNAALTGLRVRRTCACTCGHVRSWHLIGHEIVKPVLDRLVGQPDVYEIGSNSALNTPEGSEELLRMIPAGPRPSYKQHIQATPSIA